MGLTQITTGGVDDNINIDSNTLKVDGTNNRVGIGTAAPGKLLSLQDSTTPSLALYTGSTIRAELKGTSALTSLLSYSNSPITFNIGGSAETEALRIDGSGRVGIGTTSPEEILHVAAASEAVNTRDGVMFQSTSALAADTGLPLVFTSHIGNVANYGIASIAGRKENATSGDAAGYLQFATGSSGGAISERMRIDSSGTVGIGCVPSSFQSGFDALQIGGNLVLNVDSTGVGAGVYMSNNVYRDSGNSRWEYINTDEASQYYQANGEHVWRSAASGSANAAITWLERMRIDSSGNLGLGTSSPAQGPLHAHSSTTDAYIHLTNSTTGSAGSDGFSLHQSGTSTILNNRESDAMRFFTANAERMRIDSSGRLLLGTTTEGLADGNNLTIADSGPCGITLRSGSSSGGAIYFSDATSGSGEYAGFVEYLHSSDALRFASGGTERMRIDSSGNVTLGRAGTSLHFQNGFNNSTSRIQNGGGSNSSNFKFLVTNSGSESEAIRIDSSGRLLVGTSTSTHNIANNSKQAIVITGDLSRGGLDITGYTGGSSTGRCPEINFNRSIGTTDGSVTALSAAPWHLGSINFSGSTGSAFSLGAQIRGVTDSTAYSGSNSGGELRFHTTATGATSTTERMRIRSDGFVNAGGYIGTDYHRFNGINASAGSTIFTVSGYQVSGGTNQDSIVVFASADSANTNTAPTILKVFRHASNQRSINAAGSINASGNDYAEYMTKAGNFTLAKGDVCGINSEGKLTNVFADAISFVVKSTDPSYVGGDSWHKTVGAEPGGYDDDRTEEEIAAAKVVYEEALEAARQLVDRIAFSGQVPVNVTGATPGQYIVPVTTADGGITGEAKNEADLTLAEYMQAVGKVIAIEDDGRAKIVVKVA